MTRPFDLPHAVGVPDDVAYVLSHWLTNGLREARRNAERLPPDVVETVEKLDLRGAAWRNERRAAVPRIDVNCSDPVEWITSRSAAHSLGVSQRRVVALIRSGQLDAQRQRDRSWQITKASVLIRKEHMMTIRRARAA
jgi:hypothetical protein